MPTTSIQHAKQRLRRCLIEQRTLLSPEQISHASAAITAHVCGMSVFRASQTMMVYMALPHEVQTTDLILEAQRQHKRIAVPLVTETGLLALECPALAHLEAGPQSTVCDFRQGPYGILEPRDTSAVLPVAEIDLVLVPGVGFDREGNRLGYGAGYYDRFLKQLPVTTSYGGMAFHMQMVSHIPSLPHDVPMPFVVTEQGHTLCSPNSHPRDRINKGEHR